MKARDTGISNGHSSQAEMVHVCEWLPWPGCKLQRGLMLTRYAHSWCAWAGLCTVRAAWRPCGLYSACVVLC